MRASVTGLILAGHDFSFAGREFRPRLVWVVVSLLACALFARLGYWQLDRAELRQTQAQTIHERASLPPLVLTDADVEAQALRHRPTMIRGSYEPDREMHLEGRHHQGRLGFHVITPFRMSSGAGRVLVNRGWVAMRADGMPMSSPAPSSDLRWVRGMADVPGMPALALQATFPDAIDGILKLPYLDLTQIAVQFHDLPLLPVVIRLDPDEADGLVRAWPRFESKRNMHLGYALQWFGFALLVVVLFVVLSFRREDTQKGPSA